MPNKKINALDVRTAVATDLMLVGDPTTGTAYKSTLSTLPLVPYTGATGAVSLGLYGLTAGTLTLQEQALNSSTYKITQRMASNDYWSIYGFASVADYGDLYFELQDNAAFADGQRFRFHYGNASSGTPKDILLMDYNTATFDGSVQVNTLAGTGTRMVVSDANGALSTQAIPSITGFVPYTGATADVNLGVHRILAQNATIASSGSGDTATLNHTSGSGIGLNITKGGNGEGLYVNKTSGSGNAATIIGTLNATTLVKNGGTSAQILAADGSVITAGTNITISGGTISSSGGGGGMAIGGAITSATEGSILFAGALGVLQQDNANLFWDDTNNRLGIGTASPTKALDVASDILVNGLTIGKGTNSLLRNTAVGTSALLGLNVGVSFNDNTAIGYESMKTNTTGHSNTAIGSGSLRLQTTGTSNTAIGAEALRSLTTGSTNTAIGSQSLYALTTGSNNIGIGYNANTNTTTANNNIGIGKDSLFSTTSGADNIAIGTDSLRANIVGQRNIAIGGTTCLRANTGSLNIALGSYIFEVLNSGSNNVAIGDAVFNAVTTGSNNVGIGDGAGRYISGGVTTNTNTSNSILIGKGTKVLASSQTNQIVIGYDETGLGSNTTIIGNSSTITTALRGRLLLGTTTDTGLYQLDVNGTARVSGAMTMNESGQSILFSNKYGVGSTGQNIWIGNGGASTGIYGGAASNGSNNVSLGFNALLASTSGYGNIGIGTESLRANTTGANNVAIGLSALYTNTSGTFNFALGYQSLFLNTGGSFNVAIGSEAMRQNTTGGNNTSIGNQAMRQNTTGSNNVGIGISALYNNTTGGGNVAIGGSALQSSTTAIESVAIGNGCLAASNANANVGIGTFVLSINTGASNVAIGWASMYQATTGAGNVAVGYDSGRFISGGSTANSVTNNSVYIGRDSRALASGQTNQIVIGYQATGAGSNTATLGNTSITKTILRGTINAANLPTSATGLSAGDIWNDAGTLKIV